MFSRVSTFKMKHERIAEVEEISNANQEQVVQIWAAFKFGLLLVTFSVNHHR